MKKDYDACVFWEESVLKSAFYHHLRRKIGNNKTLKDVVLYPEMRATSPKGKPLRIDLAVVELRKCNIKTWEDCETRWKKHGTCIQRLIAVFEFKHWDQIYPTPLKIAVKKLEKQFQGKGVYCFDDKLKSEKLLLYFGIVLDNKNPRLPTREEIIGKPNSSMNLRLLIGGNVREKSEFRCL